MENITIFEFAKILNNREYGSELTAQDKKLAKSLGFVIVFGCSDDETIFKGAIDDDAGTFDGGIIYITSKGVFKECGCNCEHSQLAKKKAKVIEAIWGIGEYTWHYKTNIPHAVFDILDCGEKYCKAIIFSVNDL